MIIIEIMKISIIFTKGGVGKTTVCDLIYSNDENNNLQHWVLKKNNKLILKKALTNIRDKYDYILIDTQGARDILQDISILSADILLSPILPEITSIKEFNRGTISTLKNLEGITTLPILYGLIYKLDRSIDAKKLALIVQNQKDNKYYQILSTVIPQAVAFKEATTLKIPVNAFANNNKKQQQKAQKSITAITSLVKELNLTN